MKFNNKMEIYFKCLIINMFRLINYNKLIKLLITHIYNRKKTMYNKNNKSNNKSNRINKKEN